MSYVGVKPDIEYYNNITFEQYAAIEYNNWSFREESIKYLNLDLDCLYRVLVQANRQIFFGYKVNMTDCVTITSLALKIYLTSDYNNNIPLVNKLSIYNDIKLGYYGGITEVYKPHGTNLYFYDVNSLYPYVALQDMTGLYCSKIYNYNTINLKDITNLYEFFGIFYYSIESPEDKYLGLLPIKTKSGIEMSLGKWEGWYFSCSLKFAMQHN